MTVEKKIVILETSHLGQLIQTNMQSKQKVTLYLPPGLHRKLKVQAAVDSASMSALVEKAIAFYLKHPETVEEVEASYGRTHQVHICPECNTALVVRDGEMVCLKNQPSIIEEDFPLVGEAISIELDSQAQEQLVPC